MDDSYFNHLNANSIFEIFLYIKYSDFFKLLKLHPYLYNIFYNDQSRIFYKELSEALFKKYFDQLKSNIILDTNIYLFRHLTYRTNFKLYYPKLVNNSSMLTYFLKTKDCFFSILNDIKNIIIDNYNIVMKKEFFDDEYGKFIYYIEGKDSTLYLTAQYEHLYGFFNYKFKLKRITRRFGMIHKNLLDINNVDTSYLRVNQFKKYLELLGILINRLKNFN